MVKQLLPKVEAPCVGAELPSRTQHVLLPERASAPQGAGLDWSRAGAPICVCHASVHSRMEILQQKKSHYPPSKPTLLSKKVLDGNSEWCGSAPAATPPSAPTTEDSTSAEGL